MHFTSYNMQKNDIIVITVQFNCESVTVPVSRKRRRLSYASGRVCMHNGHTINRNFRDRSVPLALDTDYLGLDGLLPRRRRRVGPDEANVTQSTYAWHTLTARNSIALGVTRRAVDKCVLGRRIDIRTERQVVLYGMFARQSGFRWRKQISRYRDETRDPKSA